VTDIAGIIRDEDFAALPDAERRQFLRDRDPAFQDVSDFELDAFIDVRLPEGARRALGQPIDDYDPRAGNESATRLMSQMRSAGPRAQPEAAQPGGSTSVATARPGDIGLAAIARARPLPDIDQEGGLSEDFYEYLRTVEAGSNRGPFKAGPGPAQGERQIGYGHQVGPMTPTEISGEEADRMLRSDAAIAASDAKWAVGEERWAKLPRQDQEKLIDFAFNLGPTFSAEFPKFTKAVLEGDVETQQREYQRYYTDQEGRQVPLRDRNRRFFDRYYGPRAQLEARAEKVRGRQKPEGAPELQGMGKLMEVWDSLGAGGYGSIAGAEWNAANAFMILDYLAQSAASLTGTQDNPIFYGGAFGDLEEKYRERAQEMLRLAEGKRPDGQGVPGMIAEAVAGIPLGVGQAIVAAHAAGPIVGFAMLSALGVADQDSWTIAEEAGKGAIIGALFRFLRSQPRMVRAGALGGATYGMSSQEGVPRLIETGEMAMFGALGKPYRARPKPEIVERPPLEERAGRQLPEEPAEEPPIPEPPEWPPPRPRTPEEPATPERPEAPIERPEAEPPGGEISSPERPGEATAREGLPPDWDRADAIAFGRQLGMTQKEAESFADRIEQEYLEGRLTERETRARQPGDPIAVGADAPLRDAMRDYIAETRDPVWGMDKKCQKCATDLAAKFRGDYVEGVLVGGYPQREILHAWAEKDGFVYDAVNDLAMPRSHYERVFDLKETHRESGTDAAARAVASGRYELVSRPEGWVEENGVLRPPTGGTGRAESDEMRAESELELPEVDVGKVYGRETEIGLPDGDSLRGQYALMELGDLRTSHSGATFSPTEGYPPGMNERAYHRDRSEQDKVIRNADAFKPDEIYNDAPNALTGPPIVDQAGIVYGGNGRAMIISRVYNGLSRMSPGELRAETLARVERFGLDYNQALEMARPVIVRVVERPNSLNEQGVLARRLNEGLTQEVSAGDRGVSHGRSISEATLNDFSAMLDKLGDDQTLRALLSNNRGIVKSLERDKIITRENRNKYVTQHGTLSEDGLRMAENALVGRVIRNSDTLNAMSNGLKQRLIRAVPTILRVESTAPELGFRARVEEAVRQEGHRAANNLTMQEALTQTSMLEGRIPPDVADLMRTFQGTQLQVKRAFARYGRGVEDSANQQGTLLGPPPTPESAWKAAFSPDARKEFGIKEFRGTRSKEIRLSDEKPRQETVGAEEVEAGENWIPFTDTVSQPADARIPRKLLRRGEVLNRLVRELKLPIQQGRLRLHGHRFTQSVAGFYVPKGHPGSGTLAIRRWGDLQVAAHEIGHALADRYKVFRAFTRELSKDHILGDASKNEAIARAQEKIADELRSVSYDRTSVDEGWAEAVRGWLTQTSALESRAPTFVEAFEKALGTLPKNQRDAMYRARDEINRYFQQPAEHSIQGKIGPENVDLAAAADRKFDFKRQAYIDDLHGVRMLDELVDGRVLPMRAYERMRRLRRVPAIAHRMLYDGYPVWRRGGADIGFEGDGLMEILSPVYRSRRKERQFWAYSLARMATQLRQQVVTKTGRVAKIGNIVPEVQDRLNTLTAKIEATESKLEEARMKAETSTEPEDIRTWKGQVTRLEKRLEELNKMFWHLFENAPTVKDPLAKGEGPGYGGTRRENLFSDAEIKRGMEMETPEFRQVFDKLKEFNDHVADFAQASGLFSEQQRQNWLFTDRAFGLFREIERDRRGIGGRADPWSTGSGIHTIRGSSRNVRDPLMNILDGPSRLIQLALENDARRHVARQLLKEGGGAFGAKIPESAHTQRIAIEQVTTALKRELDILGIPFPEEVLKIKGMADAVTLWMGKKKPYGDNIMTYLEKGAPQYYQLFDPILTKSVAAMRRPEPILAWANEARKWIQDFRVMTPGFMAANATRDPVMASITTRTGKQAFTATIRAYLHQMRNSPEWREYLQQGGGGATIRRDPAFRRRLLTRYAQKKGFNPRFLLYGARDVWYAMESLGRAIENAPRFGEYMRARKKGASKGHSAFLAAEVSTDFSVKGGAATYRLLAETIPFFNAAVQGADKITRSVPGGMLGVKDGTRKYRALAGVRLGTVALYSMALAAVNWGIEEYRDLPDWDKWAYWHYFIPRGVDAKTGKMQYDHFKQPKIWEPGMVGTLAEQLVRPDNPTWSEYGADLLGIVANNFHLGLPVGISQLYEQGANQVWFTGQPIETKGMEGRMPGTRYRATTPATLRELGKKLNTSPVRMEALLRSVFGNFAGWGLHALDKSLGFEPRSMRTDELPLVSRFYERPGKYSRYVKDFYDILNDVDQVWNSYRQLEEEGDYDRADELLADPRILFKREMDRAARYVSSLNDEMNRLKMDRTLPGEERERRIEELRLERNRFMKETVQDIQGQLRGE